MRKPSEIAYSVWWWAVVFPLDVVGCGLYTVARFLEGPTAGEGVGRMTMEDFKTMPQGPDTFALPAAALQATLPEGVEFVVATGSPECRKLRMFANTTPERMESMLASALAGVADAMEKRRQAQNN